MSDQIRNHIKNESEEDSEGITWVRYASGILCLAGMSLVFAMRQSFDVVSQNTYGPDIRIGNYQLVLISYFSGYAVFQPVAGRLADIYGGKWVVWSGSVVFTMLHGFTPMMMKTEQVYVMLIGRFISGVSSAVMYPAMAVLIARWTPPSERFAMCSLVYSGVYSGSAISLCVTSWIISFRAKYEYMLYLEASCTAVWLLCFAIYARDSPQQTSRITTKEFDMIVSSLRNSLYSKHQAKRSRFPWKGIFTSRPFYAVLAIKVGLELVFHVTIARITTTLHAFRWKSNMDHLNRALLVAAPFCWGAVISVAVGMFFHILTTEENSITRTRALRSSALISCIVPLICLPADYFTWHAGELSVKPVLLMAQAGLHTMVMANHIFISPNYVGTLVGLTNGFSTVFGMLGGFMLNNSDFEDTHVGMVYGSTAIISIVATSLYWLLVSTKEQKWNNNLDHKRISHVMFEGPAIKKEIDQDAAAM